MPDLVPPNTQVVYWGQARLGALYGREMIVLWANQCGCKHQTYALEYIDESGQAKLLEQVLETSFRVVEDG